MNVNFPDPNLRLTLLQSLWTAGLAPPFDKEAFFHDVLHDRYDVRAAYNNTVDERVRRALLDQPITSEQLSRLRLVHWDGGDEIHHLIWENWDGEDDTFDVRDLRGVEQCRNVEEIEFTSGCQARDLSPVGELSSLRRLMLYGRVFDSIAPLRDLTALRELSISCADNPTNREVLAVLQGRGVDLSGVRS